MIKRLAFTVSAALLLSFTFCLYGPINLYYGNQRELWFPFSFIQGYLVVSFLATFLLITLVCSILPKKFGKIITASVFGIGLALWIEGTIMPMDYGILNGSLVDWSKYNIRMFYDGVIWILCIISSVVLSVRKEKFAFMWIVAISLLLVAMQNASLFHLIYGMNKDKPDQHILTDEGKYTLSSKNNIIVLILDSFDNGLFDQIIKENTGYYNVFHDFTYYKNVVSGFNYTQFAVPYILTGIPYDNSVPYQQYITTAYAETPLLRTLYENNYDNRIFTYSDMLPLHNSELCSYLSNQYDIRTVQSSRIADTSLLVSQMYKFTAMRYLPVALKRQFWFDSEEFENGKVVKTNDVPFAYLEKQSRDLNFYKSLVKYGFKLIDDKNAFRFYHLKGVHYPYNLNENLELIDNPAYTTENLYNQAEASLNIVRTFLEEIKKAGVYDNATIIIAADHGRINNRRMALDYMSPLLLIKTPSLLNKTFVISNAPVTNGDIAQTILSLLNKESAYGMGKSVLSIAENEKRTRYYFANTHYEKPRREGYLSDFYEFVTDGIAGDMSKWQSTGRLYTPDGILMWKPLKYELGTKITFEDGSAGYRWVKTGLLEGSTAVSFTKKANFAFTTSVKTDFQFETGYVEGNLSLALELSPIKTSKPQRFRLGFMVNGQKLEDEFEFESTDQIRTIHLNIPNKYLNGNTLYLTFLHPDAIYNPIENEKMIIPYRQAFILYSLLLDHQH